MDSKTVPGDVPTAAVKPLPGSLPISITLLRPPGRLASGIADFRSSTRLRLGSLCEIVNARSPNFGALVRVTSDAQWQDDAWVVRICSVWAPLTWCDPKTMISNGHEGQSGWAEEKSLRRVSEWHLVRTPSSRAKGLAHG